MRSAARLRRSEFAIDGMLENVEKAVRRVSQRIASSSERPSGWSAFDGRPGGPQPARAQPFSQALADRACLRAAQRGRYPTRASRPRTARPDAASARNHCRSSANQRGNTCRNPSKFAPGVRGVWEISLPRLNGSNGCRALKPFAPTVAQAEQPHPFWTACRGSNWGKRTLFSR